MDTVFHITTTTNVCTNIKQLRTRSGAVITLHRIAGFDFAVGDIIGCRLGDPSKQPKEDVRLIYTGRVDPNDAHTVCMYGYDCHFPRWDMTPDANVELQFYLPE